MKTKKYIEKIIELIKNENLFIESTVTNDMLIECISYNSKNVQNNTLFFCKGEKFNKEYLINAKNEGATIYISEIKYDVNMPYIIVNDIDKAMAIISGYFYDYAYKKLSLIGITGTKGKTTTVYIIKNILNQYANEKCAYISSIERKTSDKIFSSSLTTPEAIDLHSYFFDAVNNGYKYLVMEVSSQSVKRKRIYNIDFDYGIFLNISKDHISPHEHPNFDDYLNCKINFLNNCKNVIINKNTDKYEYILSKLTCKSIYTFSNKDNANAILKNKEIKNELTNFNINYNNENINLSTKLIGNFNLENILAGVCTCKLLNIDNDSIKKGVFLTDKIKGRMNYFSNDGQNIIVDYAHNYISFKNIFDTVKERFPNKKVITIFGAPGDKAFNRRKELAEISDINSDEIILTEDDSGYEKTESICNEIASYIKKAKYKIIVSRQEAIKYALDTYKNDCVILLLGKGTENHQYTNGKSIFYPSDVTIVSDILKIK